MKYNIIGLLACIPNVVTGHGFIVNPELTWVVNPFYDKNAPASFYQSTDAERLQNPLDVYPNLRFIVDRDVPNTNIAVIAANANKKCGMTSATGTARSISGSFQFGNNAGSGVVPHKGPCEVWVDDVRTMSSRDCLSTWSYQVVSTCPTQPRSGVNSSVSIVEYPSLPRTITHETLLTLNPSTPNVIRYDILKKLRRILRRTKHYNRIWLRFIFPIL